MSQSEEKKEAERPLSSQGKRPDEGRPAERARQEPEQGLKYVFKIAPADPKNSFDFEDVADK